MEETLYWIWLSKLKSLTALDKINLLEKYNIKQLWDLSKNDAINILKSKEKVNELFDCKYRYNLEEHLNYMKQNGIHLISIYDEIYPINLKHIYDYPVALYVKGNTDLLNNISIAVVGSRNASEYGKKISNMMSYMLSKNNINVISGLAKGIDASAHIGAIRAKRLYSCGYWKWFRSNLSNRK